ncbi:hypothetical protein D3C87_835210 [compost metagenome]
MAELSVLVEKTRNIKLDNLDFLKHTINEFINVDDTINGICVNSCAWRSNNQSCSTKLNRCTINGICVSAITGARTSCELLSVIPRRAVEVPYIDGTCTNNVIVFI